MHGPEREAKHLIENLAGFLKFTFPRLADREPALPRFNLYSAINLIEALIAYIKDCGGQFDGMIDGKEFIKEHRKE